ncbi:MAG: AI-2E family transporter [Paracoccaceae bacterium]
MSERDVDHERDPWALARVAIVGIFVVLVFAVLAVGRTFFIPVITAFLLALVFTPLRRALERWGLPPPGTAVLVTLVLIGLVGVGIVGLSGPASQWIDDAPTIGAQLSIKLRALQGSAEDLVRATEELRQLAGGGEGEGDGPAVPVGQGGDWLAAIASTAPMVIAQIVFVLVLTFFIIASGDMFYEKMVRSMSSFSDKRRAVGIAREIEDSLARYLSAITLVNAGLGVAVGLAMWGLGLPEPLLFGAIAFGLNFIPYLGALTGVALATVIAFVSLTDPWMAPIAGGVYFALTSIEGQFVTPYVVGRMLKLNTVVVFVAVAFWAWMWSFVGMIIAVPLLVVLRVFAEHLSPLRPIGEFLSGRDEPPVAPRPARAAEPDRTAAE